ncbi:hypothetical protein O6H91_03G123900 [Diphasiastrum complanatum]|uniref:Uncharacterized protein n=1 Tax=Diphasiastrum complanatum TaxID=34168 RepID=A0ACC2EB98_DIPCM|nr:hypothetical protein O6H91_03G123900 [Diphasiastrum complanatum]
MWGDADEVLVVLKNDKFKDPDKKKELQKLLNIVSQERFNQLVKSKLITDYSEGADVGVSRADEALDDDIGVAVEFEEEEGEDESDSDEVQEDREGDKDGQETHEA